jgi:hypothetical protein
MRSHWINTRAWDLTFLIGSVLIVPIVLAFLWAGASSASINLGVTALVGGPHLFATYIATFLDSRFRRSHTWMLVAMLLLVPAFVAYWTVVDFQIVLSVFIFTASVHVLHQNAYLTDIYRLKNKGREPVWSRMIDYGLLMISIYPIAAHKLVHSNFLLGDVEVLIPKFLKIDATYWLVWILFAVFLIAWIAKTAAEYRGGRLNRPKTLLIAVTTGVAFLVPAAAGGERMELAFQSLNAWHSVQYLGVVWYVQGARKQRGLIESRVIANICGEGRAAYYYGACFVTTMALLGLLVAIHRMDPLRSLGLTVSFQQYYYMGVLSCLFIHYMLDAYLFTVSNLEGATAGGIPYAAAILERCAAASS